MDNIPGKKYHEHTFYMESSFHLTQHTHIDETMTEENGCTMSVYSDQKGHANNHIAN
jgi:hypothetical protein